MIYARTNEGLFGLSSVFESAASYWEILKTGKLEHDYFTVTDKETKIPGLRITEIESLLDPQQAKVSGFYPGYSLKDVKQDFSIGITCIDLTNEETRRLAAIDSLIKTKFEPC